MWVSICQTKVFFFFHRQIELKFGLKLVHGCTIRVNFMLRFGSLRFLRRCLILVFVIHASQSFCQVHFGFVVRIIFLFCSFEIFVRSGFFPFLLVRVGLRIFVLRLLFFFVPRFYLWLLVFFIPRFHLWLLVFFYWFKLIFWNMCKGCGNGKIIRLLWLYLPPLGSLAI